MIRNTTAAEGFFRALALLILTVLTQSSATCRAEDTTATGPTLDGSKRVLVLASYGSTLPAYRLLGPALQAELEAAGVHPGDIFFEHLDLLHLRDDEQRRRLAELLEAKISPLGIDLIIVIDQPAISFLQNEAAGRFPEVPIISWSGRATFEKQTDSPRVLAMAGNLDIDGTIRHALDLFPHTRRVVFVTGASGVGRTLLGEARKLVAERHANLALEDTSGLSMEEMLGRLARLGPGDIVIFGICFEDRTGRTFTPRDVAEKVAATANAPVFVLYDTLIDLGAVGGSLLSFAAEGARIGRRAVELLTGQIEPAAYPSVLVGEPVPMFDWRQIERWDGRIGRLPEESVFVNRPSSTLPRYHWGLVVALIFVAAQFLLVLALLRQRRRGAAYEEALDRSRKRLRRILESSPAGIVLGTEDGRISEANDAFLKMIGYSRDELLAGKIYWDRLTPPEYRLRDLQAMAQARAAGVSKLYEKEYIRRDNSRVPLLLGCAALEEGDFAAFVLDVTEQRQAEEALRESEKKFRTVFEQAAVGIGRVSFTDARWIEVNDMFCRMLGYAREEFLRTPWPRITHPEDVDLDLIPFRKMAAGELDSYTVEKRFIHKKGHHVWARLTLSLVRDAKEMPAYEIAIIEDISERKKAEEALQRSEARLNAAIENLTEGAIIATEDEQVIFWNPAARAMHGFTRPNEGIEPLAETPFTFELWTPDGEHLLELDEWPMRRIRRGETVRSLELRIRRPDQGWEKIFSYSGNMIDTAGGERLIFLSCSDLTELRRTERTLQASIAEKEVMLKEIHHRVKNNMQVISSLVDLQADEVGDPAVRAIMDDVISRIHAMAMVHEKLYRSDDLARVEFADYASSLLGYLWQSQGARSAAIDLETRMHPVYLPVNTAVPCGLILNELTGNALKHAFVGREKGIVTISLEEDDGRIRLTVGDNGIGMPPGMDWERSRTLGLRIVRTLARQLHASLDVDSREGTRFTIIFERARA